MRFIKNIFFINLFLSFLPQSYATNFFVVDSGHGPNLPKNFSKNLTYDLKCETELAEENSSGHRGHGTHVLGLASKNCSECLVSMIKVFGGPQKYCPRNSNIYPEGIQYAISHGADVISMSAGRQYNNSCLEDTNNNEYKRLMCDAIEVAKLRDVIFVAASGNSFSGKTRNKVDFPANHPNVIAAGGSDENKLFFSICSIVSFASLCEASYGEEIEFHAQAKSVLSDSYPDYDWSPNLNDPELGCGDSTYPEVGKGLCTGTSMAAPVVAAKFARARHVFPLKPLNILKDQLKEFRFSNQYLGYGEVQVVKLENWITFNPLFSLVSLDTGENFYTTSPRMAMAQIDMNNYVPIGTKTTTHYPQYSFGKSLNPNSYLETMYPIPATFEFYLINIISEAAKEYYKNDLVKLYRFGNREGLFPIGTESEMELAQQYGFSTDEYLGYLIHPDSLLTQYSFFTKICRQQDNGYFSITDNCQKNDVVLGYAANQELDPLLFEK